MAQDLFSPEDFDETIAALVAAPDDDDAASARLDAARRVLDDSATRLARYRAAIEEGVDPNVVSAWVAEVEGERLAAEAVIAEARGRHARRHVTARSARVPRPRNGSRRR